MSVSHTLFLLSPVTFFKSGRAERIDRRGRRVLHLQRRRMSEQQRHTVL